METTGQDPDLVTHFVVSCADHARLRVLKGLIKLRNSFLLIDGLRLLFLNLPDRQRYVKISICEGEHLAFAELVYLERFKEPVSPLLSEVFEISEPVIFFFEDNVHDTAYSIDKPLFRYSDYDGLVGLEVGKGVIRNARRNLGMVARG